jgi:DNA invertase Pin-like site-specific DNA recombinase
MPQDAACGPNLSSVCRVAGPSTGQTDTRSGQLPGFAARLARSLRDAKDIVDELTVKGVKLSIGGSVHDPTDPVGRLLFNVLAMVAEFESDLIRARTREGMQVAKAKGHLRGKQPKLSPAQQRHLMEVHEADTNSTAELAELFNVARSTVYRTVQRQLAAKED